MRKRILALALIILAPLFLVGVTTSAPYNPWCDMDDDGDIDIYDIVEMADRYGTAGDSTKNVNVTNWPDAMSVDVTNWPVELPLFPENLILRGAHYSAGGLRWELIDEATPWPLRTYSIDGVSPTLDPTPRVIYNETYVYDELPTRAYQILGMPTVSITFNTTHTPFLDYFFVNVVVELWKLSLIGEWTNLGEVGEFASFFNGDKTDHHIQTTFKPDSAFNLTIEAYERLGINVVVISCTHTIPSADIVLYVCCSKDADDFYVDIPIVKNP